VSAALPLAPPLQPRWPCMWPSISRRRNPVAVSGQARAYHAPWFSSNNLDLILGHGFFYKLPVMAGIFLLPSRLQQLWRLSQHQERDRTWRFLYYRARHSISDTGFGLVGTLCPGSTRNYYFYVTPVVASIAVPQFIAWIEVRRASRAAITLSRNVLHSVTGIACFMAG